MKQKRQLYKIIAAAVLFAVAFMLPVSGYWRLAVWSARISHCRAADCAQGIQKYRPWTGF